MKIPKNKYGKEKNKNKNEVYLQLIKNNLLK